MRYDLPAIEDFCRAEGLCCERTSSEEIRVRICEDICLCITNTETDTYLGFADGTWHTHGKAMIMTGSDTYVELDPREVLAGLRRGDLLIGSRYLHEDLKARWIFHRQQKQDFQYFEAGESISVRRAEPAARTNGGAASGRGSS